MSGRGGAPGGADVERLGLGEACRGARARTSREAGGERRGAARFARPRHCDAPRPGGERTLRSRLAEDMAQRGAGSVPLPGEPSIPFSQ